MVSGKSFRWSIKHTYVDSTVFIPFVITADSSWHDLQLQNPFSSLFFGSWFIYIEDIMLHSKHILNQQKIKIIWGILMLLFIVFFFNFSFFPMICLTNIYVYSFIYNIFYIFILTNKKKFSKSLLSIYTLDIPVITLLLIPSSSIGIFHKSSNQNLLGFVVSNFLKFTACLENIL